MIMVVEEQKGEEKIMMKMQEEDRSRGRIRARDRRKKKKEGRRLEMNPRVSKWLHHGKAG